MDSSYSKRSFASCAGAGYITPTHFELRDLHGKVFQSMPRAKKKKSIYDIPLEFQTGNEPPVVLPPGALRPGNAECDVTPADNDGSYVAYDDYQAEETMNYGDEFNPNYDPQDDFPVDDAEWDTTLVYGQNDEGNTHLYRPYDVFIFKDTDPRASRQIYVLLDFVIDPNDNIVPIPSRFAVVTVFMVLYTYVAQNARLYCPC
jgi:hypothetical protein